MLGQPTNLLDDPNPTKNNQVGRFPVDGFVGQKPRPNLVIFSWFRVSFQVVSEIAGPNRHIYVSWCSSARSLSRSHTPTMKYFPTQRTTANGCNQDSVQEPLLGGHSPPASETKTMLCVVSCM